MYFDSDDDVTFEWSSLKLKNKIQKVTKACPLIHSKI